jgi:hypothetical protein
MGKGELEGNGHKRGAKIVHLEFGENPPVIDRNRFGEKRSSINKSHPGQILLARKKGGGCAL